MVKRAKRDLHVDQEDPAGQEVPLLLVDPEFRKRRDFYNSFIDNLYNDLYLTVLLFYPARPKTWQSMGNRLKTELDETRFE